MYINLGLIEVNTIQVPVSFPLARTYCRQKMQHIWSLAQHRKQICFLMYVLYASPCVDRKKRVGVQKAMGGGKETMNES